MYRVSEENLSVEFVPIIPRGATLQGDPKEASKTICKISTYRLEKDSFIFIMTFLEMKIVDSLVKN